jgi:hypothetical protein
MAMDATQKADWILIPASHAELEQVRQRCRRMVRQRAMLSAGVAAVPIPGVDVLSDLSLFARLIDDVNREFGLTPEQIERLQPRLKVIVYEAAIGVGGMLVGKLITRELLLHLLKRSGIKAVVKQAARLVPLAGQLVSAGIGFAVFRQIGYQHVDACAAVAQQLMATGATGRQR